MSEFEQSGLLGETAQGKSRRPENALEILFFPQEEIQPKAQPIEFPASLRPAVRHAAKRIYARLASEKEPAKARDLLVRLTREGMQEVWGRLYERKRNTKDLLYPARTTFRPQIAEFRRRACDLRSQGGRTNEEEARLWDVRAAALEGTNDHSFVQPWTDQDHAAQLFLWHVYRDTLDLKIISLVDFNEDIARIGELVKELRRKAAILKVPTLIGLAPKLVKLATECEEAASSTRADLENDRWIMVRRRGDDELRTFIASLETSWGMLFGMPGTMPRRPLLKLFADVANVALNRENVTSSQIREILRSWA